MLYNDPQVISWIQTARRDDICPFLTCAYCGNSLIRTKHDIQRALSAGLRRGPFCNRKCCAKDHPHKAIETLCGECQIPITVTYKAYEESKSGKNFCSSSCAATYHNARKTSGTRRSKLEGFIEDQLKLRYPNEVFEFNSKEAINSELDIYLPYHKLAFELNGLFHYEPIFGPGKLAQIQNNDSRKFQACLERGIELCIIDTSDQRGFTKASSAKYLDVITTIIDMKIHNKTTQSFN